MIFDKNWRNERRQKKELQLKKHKTEINLQLDKEAKEYINSEYMIFYGDFAVCTPFSTPREIDIRIFDLMSKKGYDFIGYTPSNNLYFKKN